MTWTVVWERSAMAAYRVFRADDPTGSKEVARAVANLADNPDDPRAEPWGSSGYRRLRIDRYRLLYRVEGSPI